MLAPWSETDNTDMGASPGGPIEREEMLRRLPDQVGGIGRDRGNGEEFLDVRYAKKVVNAYSLAFFERYLRGDLKAGGFLTSSVNPEEIEVRAQDPREGKPGKPPGVPNSRRVQNSEPLNSEL